MNRRESVANPFAIPFFDSPLSSCSTIRTETTRPISGRAKRGTHGSSNCNTRSTMNADNRRTLRAVIEEVIRNFGFDSLEDLSTAGMPFDSTESTKGSCLDLLPKSPFQLSPPRSSPSSCQKCETYEALLRALADVLIRASSDMEPGTQSATPNADGTKFDFIEKVKSPQRLRAVSSAILGVNARPMPPAGEPAFQREGLSRPMLSSAATLSNSFHGSATWLHDILNGSVGILKEGCRSSLFSLKQNASFDLSVRGLVCTGPSDNQSRESFASDVMPVNRCSTIFKRCSSVSDASEMGLTSRSVKETKKAVFGRDEDKKTINDYVILRTIRSGSFGRVDVVQQRGTKEFFAMKAIMLGNKATRNTRISAIRAEVEVRKRVAHPNLVNLYEVIGDRLHDTVYLVLQYIPGGSIGRCVDEGIVETVSEDTLCEYSAQIISALRALHTAGIFHRDIKPDNILLDMRGNAYLTDFGVSSINSGIRVSGVEGTPAFMPPEVCSGEKEVIGELADVWAFGVTLYQLMYGFLPFRSETFQGMMHKIANEPVRFPDEEKSVGAAIHPLLTDENFSARDGTEYEKEKEEDDFHATGTEVKSSDSFKELIRGVLEKDPERRWTVRRICTSKWLSRVIKHVTEAEPLSLLEQSPGQCYFSTSSSTGQLKNIHPASRHSVAAFSALRSQEGRSENGILHVEETQQTSILGGESIDVALKPRLSSAQSGYVNATKPKTCKTFLGRFFPFLLCKSKS